MKRSSSLAILLAALTLPSAASAAAVRLVYGRGAGAERCADEAVLRQAVAMRVGYDPFAPLAPLTISVGVKAEKKRLYGRVVVVNADGTEKGAQMLESADASCEDLLASVALAVSVMLDSEPLFAAAEVDPPAQPDPPAHADPPAPQKKDEAPSPAPTVLPPVSPVAKRDAPTLLHDSHAKPPQAISLWAALGGRASVGAWSAMALGPDLFVELGFGRLGVVVEGRYDRTTADVGTIARASVSRATGSLLPCGHFGWVVACGLATFGETWARGDVASPQTASTPYAAFGARLGVQVPIHSKVRVLGTVDVVGITTPTAIAVNGGATGTPSAIAVDQGGNRTPGGSVEASGGIALVAPIF